MTFCVYVILFNTNLFLSPTNNVIFNLFYFNEDSEKLLTVANLYYNTDYMKNITTLECRKCIFISYT